MASTNAISELGTIITNGAAAASVTKALAAAGPITDYVGMVNLALLTTKEISVLANQLKSATDSTDSANLALINGIIAWANGTSNPATTAIADATTVITNGPNAATQAKAIAAAGPIMDYVGNSQLLLLKIKELKVKLTQIKAVTDSGDANLTAINAMLAVTA